MNNFKIRVSRNPLLVCLFCPIILFGLLIYVYIKTNQTPAIVLMLGMGSLGLLIGLPFNLYFFLFTRLSIKNNELIGFNGIFNRVKVPVDRITVISVRRKPYKILSLGCRTVMLLTKSRDLITIKHVANYNELIDYLQEINKNIELDSSIYHCGMY